MIYEFSPKQDLHGYDKPWAPGAGTNKSPIETLDNVGWGESTRGADLLAAINELTAGTYTMSLKNTPSNITGTGNWVFGFSIDGHTNKNMRASVNTNPQSGIVYPLQQTFTLGEADVGTYTILYSYGCGASGTGAKGQGNFSEIQLESGSTASAFSPFSNICPPEGYNIWDPSQDKMIPVYAGYVNANTRELYLRPVYQEYAGEELVGPWMSSLDPYEEDATPTEGAFVIDFGGELNSYEITPFMLQTLLDSLGIRQHFTNGAGLLNKLMDQAQGRVRSEEELLHLSRPLNVIAIGDQLPSGITFKPISKDVLPGLPGKFIR